MSHSWFPLPREQAVSDGTPLVERPGSGHFDVSNSGSAARPMVLAAFRPSLPDEFGSWPVGVYARLARMCQADVPGCGTPGVGRHHGLRTSRAPP